ncbi:unnamed protein product [Sphagnum balticum]
MKKMVIKIGGGCLFTDVISRLSLYHATSLVAGASTKSFRLSIQAVTQAVVRKLQHLSNIQGLLVLASKCSICSPQSSDGVDWQDGRWKLMREFVIHRLLLQAPTSGEGDVVFIVKWQMPALPGVDRFTIENTGLKLVI